MNVTDSPIEITTLSHSTLDKFNKNYEDKYRIIFVLGYINIIIV